MGQAIKQINITFFVSNSTTPHCGPSTQQYLLHISLYLAIRFLLPKSHINQIQNKMEFALRLTCLQFQSHRHKKWSYSVSSYSRNCQAINRAQGQLVLETILLNQLCLQEQATYQQSLHNKNTKLLQNKAPNIYTQSLQQFPPSQIQHLQLYRILINNQKLLPYNYILQIFNSYLMIECPLCSQYTPQVYLNIQHLFALCLDCGLLLNHITKRNQYVFHTLLSFQPCQQTFEANKRLKRKRLQKKQDYTKENLSINIAKLFSKHQYQKQDSESLTISTQDTEITKEILIKQEKPRMETIKKKYDQTLKTIAKQFEPTFSKTKNSIINTTKTFRNKIAQAQSSYSNFSAELPPISQMALQSVKQGFGGLMRNFF